mmetsp:Transcript_15454/g.39372  ORF Transcript_15454/g.39372 Transcript_15454/m.39372 type:complete len:719 (-) Transcript_15454:2549-4705(-)
MAPRRLLLAVGVLVCSVGLGARLAAAMPDTDDPALKAIWNEYRNPNFTNGEVPQGWDELLEAVKHFNDDENWGLINKETIPFYDNDSVVVWEPPLGTLQYNTNGETDEPLTVYVYVLHEMLSNLTFYGGDKVINNLLEIYGYPELTGAMLNLIDIGLPSVDEILVAMWKTGFPNEVLLEISGVLSQEQNFTELFANPYSGLIRVFNTILRDSDSQMWKDLTVVAGRPLGPTIIPILNYNLTRNATADPDLLVEKTNEILPEFLENLKTLGVNTFLYNKYLPMPCLKGNLTCPQLDGLDLENMSQAYKSASEGNITAGEFMQEFEGLLLKYLESEMGFSSITGLLKEIFDERAYEVATLIKRNSPPSNHQVDVLESLSVGNYSMDIDEEVLATGFDAKTGVCMANITAAMYEHPNTTTDWLSGLGLEVVDIFPSSGSLSSRMGVLVDKSQNAVIISHEGIPYIQISFIRGIFGWLRSIARAQGSKFTFPCGQSNASLPLCEDMAAKYSNSSIFEGFTASDTVISDKLGPALQKALVVLNSGLKSDSEGKPKLYVTGHSLGGATAKNTFAQVLLRGFHEDFSSPTLYALAPPVVGNDDYVDMIEDIADKVGGSMYQIVNAYDVVPYLPDVVDVDKRNHTFFYDVEVDRVVKAQPLPAYSQSPENVFLSVFGYHSIKAQYLPLARSMVPEFVSEYQGKCESICSVEQCGFFQCPDTCEGVL